MRRRSGAAIVLTALTVVLSATSTAAAAAKSAAAVAGTGVDQVTVTVDQRRLATPVGGRFSIQTRLSNRGDSTTGPLIAHLNVASLTSDVYVDPEDWSTQRTQWVDPLAPGQVLVLTWRLQAVNAGSFDSYVVLLPTADEPPGATLSVGPSVLLMVSSRQTISGGGVLPVVLGVPVLLALLVAAGVLRRRRQGRT